MNQFFLILDGFPSLTGKSPPRDLDRFLSKFGRQAEPKAERLGGMNFKVVDTRGGLSLKAGRIVIFHVVDYYVEYI